MNELEKVKTFDSYSDDVSSGMSKVVPNRKYQDTVFSDLFKSKENLLDLYNTLHPEDKATSEDEVELITFKRVYTLGRYNDVAFMAKGHIIILVEHQSTINKNMPLRILIYYVSQLQQFIDRNDIKVFNRTLVSLPSPEFYVVYTGKKVWNAEELKFSDAIGSSKFIEVRVPIIKEEKKDTVLGGYIYFMKTVHEFLEDGKSLKDAIVKAFHLCKKEGILSDYLKGRETEIMSLLEQEYSLEMEMSQLQEEAREIGREEGMRMGEIKGIVESSKEFGRSFEETLTFVASKFSLNKSLAKDIIMSYWK